MPNEMEAFQNAGIEHNLAYVADVQHEYEVVFMAEDDGVFEKDIVEYFDIDDDEFDPIFDDEPETYVRTVKLDYQAGDLIVRQGNYYRTLDEEFLATRNLSLPNGTDEGAAIYEISYPYHAAVGPDGKVLGYDPESEDLTDSGMTNVGSRHAWLDADGDVVAVSADSAVKTFETLVQNQDRLSFDVRQFFEEMSGNLLRNETVSGVAANSVLLLQNAVRGYDPDAENIMDVRDRLSPRQLDTELSRMLEVAPFPIGNRKSDLKPLGDMIPGVVENGGSAMNTTLRNIYGPLTNTPVRDIVALVAGSGGRAGYDDPDPGVDEADATFDRFVTHGRELPIPEESRQASRSVYGPRPDDFLDTLRLAEVEGMTVLYVRDQQAAMMYFFPTNPEFVDEATFEAQRAEVGDEYVAQMDDDFDNELDSWRP